MKSIGLTGGIGSGKSVISEYLASIGAVIIDADKISREMLNKDTEGFSQDTFDKVIQAFGKEVLMENGELNRKALANIVFNDKKKLDLLENIVTKAVIKKCQDMLLSYKNTEKLVVLDAPLLFESGLKSNCDENWLVTADYEERIRRVMARDHMSREEIIARIDNQLSDDEKAKLADLVLDNSGTIEDIISRVKKEVERIFK